MMKLSLMQAVVGTLNDAYASPIADAMLAAWAHDQDSAHYFRIILVSFTKLLRAADNDDAHAAPAWMVELQAKLLRKAQTYRESFAAAIV